MNGIQVWLAVAVMASVTALLRFLPFRLFGNRPTPAWLNKLGKTLPYAIMGMLVVYCLKDVGVVSVGDWLPAFIACAVVGVLYILGRNTLVSIVAGTVSYMLLVQLVF